MQTRTIRNTFLLLLTAMIWGAGFVAQSTGGDAVGAFSFNCLRSFVGAAALLPVILLADITGLSSRKPSDKAGKKQLWTGGICCGVMLCIASNFQQAGITMGTPAGKAGFLTACYIIIVPLLGLFLHKKCTWNIWLGVLITVAGLYMLCMNGKLTLQASDVLIIICALCYAMHILIIDHFSPLVDGIRMSCIQFLICAILSGVLMFFFDMGHSAAGIAAWAPALASKEAWISILYAGICSTGMGYTLQIVGQEGVNPTIASLIMSLESVFSVIAGWIFLHEVLSLRELTGCLLIFAAVVLAQIPVGYLRKNKKLKR